MTRNTYWLRYKVPPHRLPRDTQSHNPCIQSAGRVLIEQLDWNILAFCFLLVSVVLFFFSFFRFLFLFTFVPYRTQTPVFNDVRLGGVGRSMSNRVAYFVHRMVNMFID